MKRVLMVAENPGSVEALLPVRALMREYADILFVAPPPHGDIEFAVGVDGAFRSAAPDLVVAGTGMRTSGDKSFMAGALKRGIPCIAVVEYWAHYRKRFIGTDGASIVPDWIAVPDRRAMDELLAAVPELPGDRIRAIGLTRYSGPPVPRLLSARNKARKCLGFPDQSPIILVLSQPIAVTYEGSEIARSTLGYDEVDALAIALDGLEMATGSRTHHVVLKLHPREPSPPVSVNKSNIRVVDGTVPVDPWLNAADIVIGMNSTSLIDAFRAGIPVISIQPGLDPTKDPFPLSRDGFVPCVRNAPELAAAIALTFAAPTAKPSQQLPDWLDGRAAEKLCALIQQMLVVPSVASTTH